LPNGNSNIDFKPVLIKNTVVVVAQVMPSTWSCSSSRKIEHSLARATDFQGLDWWVCLDMQTGGTCHVGIGRRWGMHLELSDPIDYYSYLIVC